MEAQKYRPGTKRQVAYLIVETDQNLPDLDELREYLSEYLPDYMIPATCVRLEAFPIYSAHGAAVQAFAITMPRGHPRTRRRVSRLAFSLHIPNHRA